MTPTEELYNELREAYQFFNDNLFDGELPGCMFTLQRKKNTFGYYSSSRFLRRDARGKTDEIALNPAFFAFRPVENTLSTLAHEMVHQWQWHCGKPSRSGYHNREWAAKMEAVGLMPSDTGAPGGKRVGQRMTHYIIDDGPFTLVCKALLKSGGMISWVDVASKKVPMRIVTTKPGEAPGEPQAPEGKGDDPDPGIDVAALTALGLRSIDEPVQQAKTSKLKYSCPECGMNVWGKPSLNVGCLDCGVRLEMTAEREGKTRSVDT